MIKDDTLITIYHYDSDGYLLNLEIAPKDTGLKPNETMVPPLDSKGLGMYKPKFDPSQNKWIETLSQEKIDKFNKIEKTALTDQTTHAAMTAELLNAKMTIKQQCEQIASLTATLLAQTKNAH